MGPEIFSCRLLSASNASIWLSVVASLAPWGTYLKDGGGVSDLCRDSSLILLRTLLSIFSLLFLFQVPDGLYLLYLLWPFSSFHRPGDDFLVPLLVKPFW